MKHLVQIPLASALLGAVIVINGYPLDAVSVLAIVFCSCLASWMLAQYSPDSRGLKAPRHSAVTQSETKALPVPEHAAVRRPVWPDPVVNRRPATAVALRATPRSEAPARHSFPTQSPAGGLHPTSAIA